MEIEAAAAEEGKATVGEEAGAAEKRGEVEWLGESWCMVEELDCMEP